MENSPREAGFGFDYEALDKMVDELREEYKIDKVGFLNDANAFGIASLDRDKVKDGVEITIGSGVGAVRLEDGMIDMDRIEQSGSFAINVKDDAPLDKGCGVKGCFAAYLGADGVIDIAERLGLPGIMRKSKISVFDITEILKGDQGTGYAETRRVYEKLAEPLASWIKLMHKMSGDKNFILSGGTTAGPAGNILARETALRLSERLEHVGISVSVSNVDREYGGAIGAALFSMTQCSQYSHDYAASVDAANEDTVRASSSGSTEEISNEAILPFIETAFRPSPDTLKKALSRFQESMNDGLQDKPSSLQMLPTFVGSPTGNERGEYLALDVGGTDLRVQRVRLKKGRIEVVAVKRYHFTDKHKTGTAQELFSFIAGCVKSFMDSQKMDLNKKTSLGFTWSFPVEQAGIASGIHMRWAKGWKTSGVVGNDVTELLSKALVQQGVSAVKVDAVCDDTVGTLIAGKFLDPRCSTGVILGTGTNGSIMLRLEDIKKWDGPDTPTADMAINMEWGNFNLLDRTPYDIALDAASDNKGAQILEKMVSGMYLGEVARLILNDLISRGMLFGGNAKIKTFTTEDMSAIEADGSSNLWGVNSVLKRLGIEKASIKDRELVKHICDLVSTRSTSIAAMAIAAAITKIDPELSRKHIVAVDGSLFEKYPDFKAKMKHALRKILPEDKSDNIELVLTKDGSGIGAAVIAAVVSSPAYAGFRRKSASGLIEKIEVREDEQSAAYKYAAPVSKITKDLRQLAPDEENKIREDIEDMYKANLQFLRYSPADIDVSGSIKMSNGCTATIASRVRIGSENTKKLVGGESAVTHIFTMNGNTYLFGPRGRNYGYGHMVLGRPDLEQGPLTPELIEAMLHITRIRGEDYESFFNGVGPGGNNFHMQSLKRVTAIWGIEDLSVWPAFAVKLSGEYLKDLSHDIYEKYSDYLGRGIKCDIFMHYDDIKMNVILIPRETDKPGSFISKQDSYGTFGALEMAGYICNLKTREAEDELIGEPGLYEDALKQLSLEPESPIRPLMGPKASSSFTGRQSSTGSVAEDIADMIIKKRKVRAAIGAFFNGKDQISDMPGILCDASNILLDALENDHQQMKIVRRFYSDILKKAKLVSNSHAEDAKHIHTIAGQALNIISWMERGDVPGTEHIRLTYDRKLMVKSPDKDREPSFMNVKTLPQAMGEGKPGTYHRGVEGIDKMGVENIAEEAIYDHDIFDNAKFNFWMYLMFHGYLKVPDALIGATHEGLISTMHKTRFITDLLPGSIQFTSTGPGHFQGTTLDIKYVTAGHGIQYNKIYNENGELVRVIAQKLRPGSWAVALPGAVDSVENLGGLAFRDFSIKVADERLLSELNPSFDFSMIEEAEANIKKASKNVPYFAVSVRGKWKLARNLESPPPVEWVEDIQFLKYYENLKGLAELYNQIDVDNLNGILNVVASSVSREGWVISTASPGETLLRSELAELAANNKKLRASSSGRASASGASLRGTATQDRSNLKNGIASGRTFGPRNDGSTMTRDGTDSIRIDMDAIHDIYKEIPPAIKKGNALWHVMPETLIPLESRGQFRAFAARINRLYSEKIKVVNEGQMEDLKSIVEGLSADGNVVDVALDNERYIENLPKVPTLIFKPKDGEIGDFRQLEGIIASLRALHIKDRVEREERLKTLYELLTGTAAPKKLPDIEDPTQFARLFQFVLPPIAIRDSKELQSLNRNMQSLIESA